MASYVTNRGIVYWTNREKQIILDNINTPLDKLMNLLPGRSLNAIYQYKMRVRRGFINKPEVQSTVQKVYPVIENQSAKTITFEVNNMSITIHF